ncbi:MAG: ABC transporter ATP-binding protein, partial [Anaerolineales bacterium]|nr:ABC transporter ATP-binding protein [Anaerolineales bacterium]
GLLPLAGGEVWINGRSTQNRAVADICREVGYLPQNPDDLLFAESVEEELMVTLRNHAVEEKRVGLWKRIAYSVLRNQNNDTPYALRPTPYVEALLGQLGLTAVSHSYPRDLSVGQRQRVALGAVTVTQPGLLLLDEPTRGLDDAAKGALVAIWRGWQAAGMGILLVTHDVELVAAVADRVVTLAAGRVVDEIE